MFSGRFSRRRPVPDTGADTQGGAVAETPSAPVTELEELFAAFLGDDGGLPGSTRDIILDEPTHSLVEFWLKDEPGQHTYRNERHTTFCDNAGVVRIVRQTMFLGDRPLGYVQARYEDHTITCFDVDVLVMSGEGNCQRVTGLLRPGQTEHTLTVTSAPPA